MANTVSTHWNWLGAIGVSSRLVGPPLEVTPLIIMVQAPKEMCTSLPLVKRLLICLVAMYLAHMDLDTRIDIVIEASSPAHARRLSHR